MNLAAAAMRYRAIVLTLAFLLMVWGVISFFTMPRREDPEYTVRTCAVTTVWPGAPATKVEELVTKPIEEACDRIDAVDIVYSTTTNGLSTVFVDAEDTVSAASIDNVWGTVTLMYVLLQLNLESQDEVVILALKEGSNDTFTSTFW